MDGGMTKCLSNRKKAEATQNKIKVISRSTKQAEVRTVRMVITNEYETPCSAGGFHDFYEFKNFIHLLGSYSDGPTGVTHLNKIYFHG